MIPTPDRSCDVVVVGGGPAGAVCAALLARSALDVVLVDDGRSRGGVFPETLSPAAVRALEEWKIPMPPDVGSPCRYIKTAWDSSSPEIVELAWLRCRPSLTVDRPRFDRVLREVASCEGVAVVPGRATHLTVPADGTVVLELDVDGRCERLACRALIDATGRKGIPSAPTLERRIYFDRLVALSCPVARAVGADQLWLFATENGWWYATDHPGAGSVAVFLTDGDLLPRAPLLEDWLDRELSANGVPIELTRSSAPDVRDARTSCRRMLTRGGWLPIGDAAYSIDPLSGSGLENAIRSAGRAAVATTRYLHGGDRQPFTDVAVAVSQEVAGMLSERARNYAAAASRFPQSEFWNRRTAMEMQ